MTQAPETKTPPAPWNDIPWAQWEDWRWQLASRLTTVEQIGQVIHLTKAEKTGIANSLNQLRMAITPRWGWRACALAMRLAWNQKTLPEEIENPANNEAVYAINKIDLNIPPNEFFTLLGPSGCGRAVSQGQAHQETLPGPLVSKSL